MRISGNLASNTVTGLRKSRAHALARRAACSTRIGRRRPCLDDGREPARHPHAEQLGASVRARGPAVPDRVSPAAARGLSLAHGGRSFYLELIRRVVQLEPDEQAAVEGAAASTGRATSAAALAASAARAESLASLGWTRRERGRYS